MSNKKRISLAKASTYIAIALLLLVLGYAFAQVFNHLKNKKTSEPLSQIATLSDEEMQKKYCRDGKWVLSDNIKDDELIIDPGLTLPPDITAQRLRNNGITRIILDPSDPYGASFLGTNIYTKDQASLDKAIEHELGHRIWYVRVTSEEKALFKGDGYYSKQAIGRPGYTQDMTNSEDFAGYISLALKGRINEVPAPQYAVIKKYIDSIDEKVEIPCKSLLEEKDKLINDLKTDGDWDTRKVDSVDNNPTNNGKVQYEDAPPPQLKIE